MVPDWPLYFPLGPGYQLTHSFPGVLIACLPMGLVFTIIFLLAARRPLFELAANGLQQRLAGYLNVAPEWNIRGVLGLSVAVCVGAVTHIVWDAFTHASTWGVAMFPSLNDVWITVFGIKFAGYMALQHGCSLVGLPLLLVLYLYWFRRAECQPVPEPVISPVARWVWIIVLVGFPLGAMIRHIAFMPQMTLRPVIMAFYYGVTEAGFMLIVLIVLMLLSRWL